MVPGSKAEIKVRGNDPRAVATLNNGVISNPGDYAVMEMNTKNIPDNVNEVAVKVAVTDGSVVVEKNYKLEVVEADGDILSVYMDAGDGTFDPSSPANSALKYANPISATWNSAENRFEIGASVYSQTTLSILIFRFFGYLPASPRI